MWKSYKPERDCLVHFLRLLAVCVCVLARRACTCTKYPAFRNKTSWRLSIVASVSVADANRPCTIFMSLVVYRRYAY